MLNLAKNPKNTLKKLKLKLSAKLAKSKPKPPKKLAKNRVALPQLLVHALNVAVKNTKPLLS